MPSLLVALAATWLSAQAADQAPRHRHLFADDRDIASMRGLTRIMHQPEKRGAVLKPDIPSDGKVTITASAPLWIPEEKRWRWFYEARHGEGARHSYALAVSRDGVRWEKPSLGLVEFAGSKNNNLFPTPDGLRLWQVVYDPHDPDRTRRYKGFLGATDRQPAVSEDGLHWRATSAPKLPSHDAGTLTYDRENHLFLGLLKFIGPKGRAYRLATSPDFDRWTEPALLFETDELDQRMATDVIRRRLANAGLAKPWLVDPDPASGWKPPRKTTPTWRAECYNIGLFPYEGLYFGLLMMYYPTGQRPDFRNADGFHLIQLAMTRDLRTWERLGDRQPFLAPSPITKGLVGNYDRVQLMPTNEPVLRGEELWFYYGGFKMRVPQHNQWSDGSPRDPATLSEAERADWLRDGHAAMHLAVLRRDGFVSLDAGTAAGHVETKPWRWSGKRMLLNLDAAAGGEASVEVREGGKTVAESAPVRGNSTRAEVRWMRGGTGGLEGREVSVRIVLRKASLYSFWVE